MEHCYCYDFTKKTSRIPYQGCKLFRIPVKDFKKFDSFSIRSLIDPGAHEFKLTLEDFDETCKDVETDKAWFKLMHLIFGFFGEYDVKGKIAYDIERHLRTYYDYADTAKEALSCYIELLRTGKYDRYDICGHEEFYKKMSVDNLVDLLEKELRLRTTVYKKTNSPEVLIFEITDYHYDYDALYEKYGIVDPEDTSSGSYNDFIAYITTSEETMRLKRQQAMYAQMYYGE